MKPFGRLFVEEISGCGGVAPPTTIANLASAEGRKSLLFEGSDQQNLGRSVNTVGAINGFYSIRFKLSLITDATQHGYMMSNGITGINVCGVYRPLGGDVLGLHDSGGDHWNSSSWNIHPARFRDPSAWYHLVILDDGTTHDVYLNGVLCHSQGTVPNFYRPAGHQSIGCSTGTGGAYASWWSGYQTMIAWGVNATPTISDFGEINSSTNQWSPKDPPSAIFSDPASFYLSGEEDITDDFANTVLNPSTVKTHVTSLASGGVDLFIGRDSGNAGGATIIADSLLGSGEYLPLSGGGAQVTTGTTPEFEGDGMTFAGSAYGLALKSDPDKGFNLVAHTTGAGTIAHGLPSAPKLVIFRSVLAGATQVWIDGMTGMDQYIPMNSTYSGPVAGANLWGATPSDATNFTIGTAFAPGTQYNVYFFCDVPNHVKVDVSASNISNPGFKVKSFLNFIYGGLATGTELMLGVGATQTRQAVNLETGLTGSAVTTVTQNPTTLDVTRPVHTGFTTMGRLYLGDNSYLREFAKSAFGSVEFDSLNFPSWENQYSDSPFNNHPVANPLEPSGWLGSGGGQILSQGNLRITDNSGTHHMGSAPIRIPKTGTDFIVESTNTGLMMFGLSNRADTKRCAIQGPTGIAISNIGGSSTLSGAAISANVYTMIIDSDNLQVTFLQDGGSALVCSVPWLLDDDVQVLNGGPGLSGTGEQVLNFGQKPFIHAPITHTPISSVSLADTYPIIDSRKMFGIVSWTGNGTSQSITGLDFSPGWVMIKATTGTNPWMWFDTARGVGFGLQTNTTAAETFSAQTLTAFDSNGFSVGNHTSVNQVGIEYVAYCFNIGDCTGIDISTYTGNNVAGRQIPHNLGEVPGATIHRARNIVANWHYWYKEFSALESVYLNGTGPTASSGDFFNSTLPTATDITVGGTASHNQAGVNYLQIAMKSIPGFSSYGSYIGNNSADGPFIPLSFKPAFVIVKQSTGAAGWWILIDNVNNTNNPVETYLLPHDTDAAAPAAEFMDLLSNGFKLRSGGANNPGQNYIYWAVAECPQAFATAR